MSTLTNFERAQSPAFSAEALARSVLALSLAQRLRLALCKAGVRACTSAAFASERSLAHHSQLRRAHACRPPSYELPLLPAKLRRKLCTAAELPSSSTPQQYLEHWIYQNGPQMAATLLSCLLLIRGLQACLRISLHLLQNLRKHQSSRCALPQLIIWQFKATRSSLAVAACNWF